MTFEALGLHTSVIKALTEAGYTKPTDVQTQAVPAAIAGRDLLVSSQTGSGKTAAYGLGVLQQIDPTSAPPPVPGASGVDHPTVANAGHFLQEDAGSELGEIVARFLG